MVVRGGTFGGELVEQFGIPLWFDRNPKTVLRGLKPQTIRRDYRHAVRPSVTPALIFSAPVQGVANHDPCEGQLLHSCPGVEPFKLIKTAPLRNLRLLPSVIFNVVTPPSQVGTLLASGAPEGFRLPHEALLARFSTAERPTKRKWPPSLEVSCKSTPSIAEIAETLSKYLS